MKIATKCTYSIVRDRMIVRIWDAHPGYLAYEGERDPDWCSDIQRAMQIAITNGYALGCIPILVMD
jgi:hypothetical protein